MHYGSAYPASLSIPSSTRSASQPSNPRVSPIVSRLPNQPKAQAQLFRAKAEKRGKGFKAAGSL